MEGAYQLLLMTGLLVSIVSFLIILFNKGTRKSKVFCTLVVAIVIQRLTEPLLIKSSYLIFLKNNSKELKIVNHILSNKSGAIFILEDGITDKDGVLTQAQKHNLLKLREEMNLNMIIKSDNGVYYELYGFLDTRLGITYWTKMVKPNSAYNHLKDKWYY